MEEPATRWPPAKNPEEPKKNETNPISHNPVVINWLRFVSAPLVYFDPSARGQRLEINLLPNGGRSPRSARHLKRPLLRRLSPDLLRSHGPLVTRCGRQVARMELEACAYNRSWINRFAR